MSELTMRRATAADWDDIVVADARAFGMTVPFDEQSHDYVSKVLDNDAMRVVRDGSVASEPLVGVGAFYRMQITPPGGAPTPAAGLTWVSVAATHRRRGILRTMITDLADQWRDEGYPFAILTATEATIYERFGFGVAMFTERVAVPTGASWRVDDSASGTVHYATTSEAVQEIPRIHARWAAGHPGAITRVAPWWEPIFADRQIERSADVTQLFYLLHDDGYAMYRMRRTDGVPDVEVEEIVAITDEAHDALWRVLTSLDRTGTVHADLVADDPLSLKLADFRSVRHTARQDTVWVSILDVPAALRARRYRSEVSVVVEVARGFGSAGERFSLVVRDGEATVEPTTAAPEVTVTLPTLGSLYFGGCRATDFARAGRIDGTADGIAALDAAFATDRLPVSGTFF